jgi:hypothetical protein
VFGDLSRSALGVGVPPRPDQQEAEAAEVTVAELAPVISLQPYQKCRLAPFEERQVPEPTQLYSLIGLALVLHAPVPNGELCVQYANSWGILVMPERVVRSPLLSAVDYICVDERDEAVVAQLRKDIAATCQQEVLTLTTSFVDRGCDGSQLRRPGLIDALETLKRSPGTVLVVVSIAYHPTIQSAASCSSTCIEITAECSS